MADNGDSENTRSLSALDEWHDKAGSLFINLVESSDDGEIDATERKLLELLKLAVNVYNELAGQLSDSQRTEAYQFASIIAGCQSQPKRKQLILLTWLMACAISNGFLPSEFFLSILRTLEKATWVLEMQLRAAGSKEIVAEILFDPSQLFDISVQSGKELTLDFSKLDETDDELPDSTPVASGGTESTALNEVFFWAGLARMDSSNAFTRALSGPLPRKMHLICLVQKADCCASRQEYDEALASLVQLQDLVKEPESRLLVALCRGYIECLRDHRPATRTRPIVSLSTSEWNEDNSSQESAVEEAERIIADAKGRGFPAELAELLRRQQQELKETVMREVREDREANLKAMKELQPPAWDEISAKIRRTEPWVKDLANASSLVTAECIYETLNKRSWAEVVVAYSNAVEAELKKRVLLPLERFLIQKQGSPEIWLGRGKAGQDERIAVNSACGLLDVERLLIVANSNACLKEFFNKVAPDDRPFLVSSLPSYLNKLRTLRNPSAHGTIVKEIGDLRDQTLQTLKRLSAIAVPGV